MSSGIRESRLSMISAIRRASLADMRGAALVLVSGEGLCRPYDEGNHRKGGAVLCGTWCIYRGVLSYGCLTVRFEQKNVRKVNQR